jgi:hypothetical protein
MRMGHIAICGLPALQYFSTISHNGMIFGKKVIEYNMLVSIFSIQLLSQSFLIIGRNERDMIKYVY